MAAYAEPGSRADKMKIGSGALLARLESIVGRKFVLTGDSRTRPFATGYRCGGGPVLAVVQPGSLVEQWRVLRACVEADCIVISQASNTGLTGGSTPMGEYDREVVVISTTRLEGFHLIDSGRQVICLPGTTLYALERALAPIGREPHSVIGSSCIGASVVGGVCNNSGGALVRRGPVYTEYALYAKVAADGTVELVNHLGVRLEGDAEEMLEAVETRTFSAGDINDDGRAASDPNYGVHVRDVDADTPARFNADPQRLFEASGSAGRLMLFAVRLDTFEREAETVTFYVGTNETAELTLVRRRLLAETTHLPIAGEYMHRDAYDVAERYGKDVFLAIRYLGTDRLPRLFGLKNWIDALARRISVLPKNLSDRIMQAAGKVFPRHLPQRMREFRDAYAHHLMIKVSGDGAAEARRILGQIFPSAQGAMFECTQEEAEKAFLHRFAAAGAAVRYRAIHESEVEDIVALDIALRRNDEDWFETLPEHLSKPIIKALYYGHFFCHVFHQDYILHKGVDPIAYEHGMWELLDERGAEYPAEHNVGHLYKAKPPLAAHYHELDPGNRLNPGIGLTSRNRDWT